jgi:acetolactate synthase-1/2/3 large subunit
MKLRVADYIAARLTDFGIKHSFIVTGGGAMHLNDAFARNKQLKTVCFHHEQSAAMAAEAYCRLTNNIALLNVTTGPGGINALNGVYGAYTDSIGMIVVSGQVKRETYLRSYSLPIRQLGDQEIDIVSMVKPIVKYAITIMNPEDIGVVMDKALLLISSGKPGPVWIDVPIDVQSAMINTSKLKRFSGNISSLINDDALTENTVCELRSKKTSLTKNLFNQFLKLLKKSKRPVLFAGSGVRVSGTHNEFMKLVKKLKIPVVTGWNAHDIIANDDPYYCGRPGTVGDRPGNFTVQNADFIIILGSRLNIRQISYNYKSFAQRAFKVMVDIDYSELTKPTLDIDLPICSDLKSFIPFLLNNLQSYTQSKNHHEYLAWCRERVAKYPTVLASYRSKKNLINPYTFIKTLTDNLKQDDVIVTGNGSACVITFQAANLKKGQRMFTNSGSASMGYDLPAAIGASISSKNKRIICIAGDGSLMMNIQELETVKNYNLPIKIIILNNQGYASIKQTQNNFFPDNVFGVGPSDEVSFPIFEKVGKAFAIKSKKLQLLMNGRVNQFKIYLTQKTQFYLM